MTTPIITSIALDLGTTSIKAGLLDQNGTLSHIVALPAPAISGHDGRYESDALDYAATAEQVLGTCLAQAGGVPPLGLCSQRSSFLIWERASGRPLTPLISWQDDRGAESCDALRAQESVIHTLTGLRLTPYYLAPKLRILLQENPQWHTQLERGELLLGTLDTFLIWRWTGGKHHATDASMAARSLLMDIQQQQWSPQLCELFGISPTILPRITPSAGLNLPLNNGLILQASMGDQSAALIASVGANSTDALVNLGTGGFVIRYLAQDQAMLSGYLRTLVYQDHAAHAHTAIEGTLNSIAAALAPYPVQECRIEDLAAEDIYCLAEPSGIGAPYFRSDLGLQFSSSVAHLTQRQIAALLLEAIVFRVVRILEDFHREAAINRVFLSGGLSELTCLQQGIALCLPFPVHRLQQKDTSLQGAAFLAAAIAPVHQSESTRIEITCPASPLPQKYLRWKDWLDALLDSR